jgi:hypothetical protein
MIAVGDSALPSMLMASVFRPRDGTVRREAELRRYVLILAGVWAMGSRALIALGVSIVIIFPVGDGNKPARALTVELAKKCREMAVKAYPPAVVGSRHGTAQKERDYFQSCIAEGGQPPTESEKK